MRQAKGVPNQINNLFAIPFQTESIFRSHTPKIGPRITRYGMIASMHKNFWIVGALSLFAVTAFANTVQVGQIAPNFTLPSQEDKPVSLSDYKGKWVILYFYPKDQTTGCTIEAHNFQRDLPKYNAANAVVLGVSLDTVEGHKTWCSKDTFDFKLLADPEHKVVDAYGVPVRSFAGFKIAERQTFLISPDGKVAKTWPKVDVKTHSTEILSEINSTQKSK